ncbi:MAG: hypothetical protein Q8M15_12465 [Bacteroidota bacterium]|nr:hypothetical protein [Bacteroidota bacterium]
MIKKIALSIILMLGIILSNNLHAQDEAVADASGKKAPNLTIVYNNMNNQSRSITVSLTKKEGKKWIPVVNLSIALYLNSTDAGGLLGTLKTNERGKAEFILNNARFKHIKDSAGAYQFIAQLRNNSEFEDTDAEIFIKESNLKLSLTEDAGVKTAKVILSEMNNKMEWVPLKDADVRFYVQKTYSLLPLSEGNLKTDDAGEASIEIPAGISGDEKGNITIVARLEENETFGAVISTESKGWGTPVVFDNNENERNLWASRANAPLVLVIGVNAVLFGIWGVICYILFLLFKVKQLGKKNEHQININP